MPRAKRATIINDDTWTYRRPEKGIYYSFHRLKSDNLVMQSEHERVDRKDMLNSAELTEWKRLINYMGRLKYHSLWIKLDWNELDRELHDT